MSEYENSLATQEAAELTRVWKAQMGQRLRAAEQMAFSGQFEAGRTLLEVKAKLGHGEWTEWVETYSTFGLRSCQKFMQTYDTFKDDPQIMALGYSKAAALLPLPEGKLQSFAEANDLEGMSVREIREAVEKARQEERAKTDDAVKDAVKKARKEGEKAYRDAFDALKTAQDRIAELEEQGNSVNADLAEQIKRQEGRINELQEELVERNNELLRRSDNSELNQLKKDLIRLQKEKEEAERERDEAEDTAESAKSEATRLKMQLSHGSDTEASGPLSCDRLAAAVRAFLGTAGAVPFMAKDFSVMKQEEKREFVRCIEQICDWGARARKAVQSIEGAFVE